MSDTLADKIVASATEAGVTEAPDTGDNLASEVADDVKEWEENDPLRKLSKQVHEDLAVLDDAEAASKQAKEATQETSGESYEEEKARLAKVFKERNKVFKEREAQKAEAEAITREAYRVQAEAMALAQQVKEQAAWIAGLRQDPVRALQAAGIDPERFIMDLAQQGTPEGAQSREMAELKAKAKEWDDWKAEQQRRAEDAQRQQQTNAQKAFRGQVETQFISAAKSDKYSNVKSALELGILSEKALLFEGDRIADEYRDVVGQEASLEDILEYFDEQVGKAYSKLKGPSQVVEPKTQVKPSPGNVGKKTLAAEDGSERRTLEAPVSKDAVGDERLQRAKQAVKLVLDKNKTRKTD